LLLRKGAGKLCGTKLKPKGSTEYATHPSTWENDSIPARYGRNAHKVLAGFILWRDNPPEKRGGWRKSSGG
jgi:hypothetical protein